eukprot:6595470-Pyramimonas_sp.AAC.1
MQEPLENPPDTHSDPTAVTDHVGHKATCLLLLGGTELLSAPTLHAPALSAATDDSGHREDE